MTKQSQGIILVLLSAVFFGLMGPFAVIAKNDGLSQSSLLLYRFFLAFLIFFSVASYRKEMKGLKFKVALPAFLMGAIAYFMQSYFYFSALDYIGVGLTSILLYVYPALVVVLLWIFKGQKPSLGLWLGIALAFIGVALCFAEDAGQAAKAIGVYLALAAAMTYSCYLVVSESVLDKLSPLLVSTFVCLGAATSYFVKILLQESFTLPETMNGYLALIGLTLLATVFGILFIFKGIEMIGAARASVLSSVEPVTAVLVGILFMQEDFSWLKFIGFALVMTSVVYISTRKKN